MAFDFAYLWYMTMDKVKKGDTRLMGIRLKRHGFVRCFQTRDRFPSLGILRQL